MHSYFWLPSCDFFLALLWMCGMNVLSFFYPHTWMHFLSIEKLLEKLVFFQSSWNLNEKIKITLLGQKRATVSSLSERTLFWAWCGFLFSSFSDPVRTTRWQPSDPAQRELYFGYFGFPKWTRPYFLGQKIAGLLTWCVHHMDLDAIWQFWPISIFLEN